MNFKRMSAAALQAMVVEAYKAQAELQRRAKSALVRLPGGRVKTSQGIWNPSTKRPQKAGVYRASDCPHIGWGYSRWTGKLWMPDADWARMHERGHFYWLAQESHA